MKGAGRAETQKIAPGEVKSEDNADLFYGSKGIVHKEFVPPGQNVNAVFYLGVLKRLVRRIRRVRPEYREDGSWRLLHDNAPSHRSTLLLLLHIQFFVDIYDNNFFPSYLLYLCFLFIL